MTGHRFLYHFLFLLLSTLGAGAARAQSAAPTDNRWGPHDTIITQAIIYEGEMMSYKELEMVWVSNLPPDKLAKAIEKYNRLRNAVYVTYPYARLAGNTLNEISARLVNVQSKKQRKEIIKSREKELKSQFTDPLSNLSVYQGKVLMKLINRQTGNNCYEIIKEYKGGLNARMYQTVAFFFGSSLKQDYDIAGDATDRQIESIVKEIDGAWYQNPYKPGVRN
ncbi:MAG TPA: DUF4294 domain-containing protein [Chitinophagaceae bacterium]|jgi:benzoyl-CoA reductase/2-hydroxyglutaryl-CoA dehydratase subunit BcrC/BadD/HgdB|nr:DUF4294 domain-containing protein [Chitinophagaceae bacterium]